MEKYDVLAIGELNVDIILPGLKNLPIIGREILAEDCSVVMGSSTAICACGLANLGSKVDFFGKVGKDYFGKVGMSSLKEYGVNIENIIEDEKIKTGASVSLVVGNDRAFVTNPGSIKELSINDIDFKILESTKHLHVGSYFLQSALKSGIPQLFKEAHNRNVTTSLDAGWDVSETWDDSIYEALQEADIFFPNETEVLHITKEKDIYKAVTILSKYSGIVAAKRGKQGAIAISNGQIFENPAYDTGDPIDTTGAGDSFNAGFIYGFLQGYDIKKCLQYGTACGSVSTSRIGGASSCATIDEVEDLIRSEKILKLI